MSEWVFILISIIVIFFAVQRLKKDKVTKAEIILSGISYIILITLFSKALFENFSYRRLLLLFIFLLIAAFSFNKKYQNYKMSNNP
jgi:hypothetical protein